MHVHTCSMIPITTYTQRYFCNIVLALFPLATVGFKRQGWQGRQDNNTAREDQEVHWRMQSLWMQGTQKG